jgi:hypothetical protein
VEFIVPETNERFGPFISQGDGSYLVGLPGPGTYQMEISVTGSNQLFKEELIVPFVDEEMELQQELIYAMVDSKEQLKASLLLAWAKRVGQTYPTLGRDNTSGRTNLGKLIH